MNETSTSIPGADMPEKARLNPRWFLVRFLAIVQPILIDVALGYWAWTSRVIAMSGAVYDDNIWALWRLVHLILALLAGFILVMGYVITCWGFVTEHWNDPVQK